MNINYQNSLINFKVIFISIIMQVQRQKVVIVDQRRSQTLRALYQQNDVLPGICGYVTISICHYFGSLTEFDPLPLKIAEKDLVSEIQRSMKQTRANRLVEIKRYDDIMPNKEKKGYLRSMMASYEVADYLQSIVGRLNNKQMYFFRIVQPDHEEYKRLDYQMKKRALVQQKFLGQGCYYTKFGQTQSDHPKDQFVHQLRQIVDHTLPIIIAVHNLGHFNTIILFRRQIYILQSRHSELYDQGTINTIISLYKRYLHEIDN